MAGCAVVAVLALTSGARAQTPAPPDPTPRAPGTATGTSDERFTALPRAHVATLTGADVPTDPDAIVSATVVLIGDAVVTTQARAARTKRTFDRRAAERSVGAAQARVVPELESVGATVDGTVTQVLNAVIVHGTPAELARMTQVAGVAEVHISRQVTRDNGTSNAYTGASAVWNATGNHIGTGVKIGIIDDGIDYTHADFGGSGLVSAYTGNDRTTIEPGTFPTAKVAGGFDFVGDTYTGNAAAINDDPDPLACGPHGTHVAGTAAGQGVRSNGTTFTGPYNSSTINATTFAVAPGSAPGATLYAYKVFGCTDSASDAVIILAINQAITDGMDVINLSLGSSFGTATEPMALALDNASVAGVLPVVAAGNSGPGPYLVSGPGTANRALAVAAADTSASTVPGVSITGGITYSAQNSNSYNFTGSITGTLFYVGLGGTASDYVGASGKIAVADSGGGLEGSSRATLAQEAGALAVIFINNEDFFPPIEGPISGVTIPFVGVNPSDTAAVEFYNTVSVTLSASAPVANPAYRRFAPFSSSGPSLDHLAKPDITAPGNAIMSASKGTGTGALTLSGTSMATPHAAGIAALVAETHPTWAPDQLKGALMGTAATSAANGLADYGTVRGGTGMVDATAAVNTQTTFTTTDGRNNLSFGYAELSGSFTAQRPFRIYNDTAASVTYDLSSSVDTLGLGAAASVTFGTPSTTVLAHSFADVQVTIHISDPSLLPTVQETAEGVLPAITGLVIAIPRVAATGVSTLHVPLLLLATGASDVQAFGTSSLRTDSLAQVPDNLKIHNAGVHEGWADVYQWALTDAAGDNSTTDTPDIREVGVQLYAGSVVSFVINVGTPFSTQSVNRYKVSISTTGDATPEYDLIGADDGILTSGIPNGLFSAYLFLHNAATTNVGFVAPAPYDSGIVELPVELSALGNPSSFTFTVSAESVIATDIPDTTGTGRFDPSRPGVGQGTLTQLLPGGTILVPAEVDIAAARTQGALGWLVVTVDDTGGTREADRVPLAAARPRRST